MLRYTNVTNFRIIGMVMACVPRPTQQKPEDRKEWKLRIAYHVCPALRVSSHGHHLRRLLRGMLTVCMFSFNCKTVGWTCLQGWMGERLQLVYVLGGKAVLCSRRMEEGGYLFIVYEWIVHSLMLAVDRAPSIHPSSHSLPLTTPGSVEAAGHATPPHPVLIQSAVLPIYT